jgi:hypothetical protein
MSRRGLLASATTALFCVNARSETSVEVEIYSAPAMVDSVGINSHLSSGPYASRFETVEKLLRDLGVRHLRDEIHPDRGDIVRMQRLSEELGIRFNLLVSPATNTVPQMMQFISALGIRRLSAIEGQNEGDHEWFMAHPVAQNDWRRIVVDYQRSVHSAVRQLYSPDVLPLGSPTVLNYKPEDMRAIADAAHYCDFVALHAYVQGAQEPETTDPYAALSWYLENMRDPFKPGAPAIVTEAGYNTQAGAKTAVSETAAAIYTLRLLLNNFMSGIRRTFIYELLDQGHDPTEWEQHFGLVRADDTPKPSYSALQRLLGALNGKVLAARPGRRWVELVDGPPDVKLAHFRKDSGELVVALWRTVRCWDPAARRDIDVLPASIELRFQGDVSEAALMIPNDRPSWSDLKLHGKKAMLTLGAKVTLIAF